MGQWGALIRIGTNIQYQNAFKKEFVVPPAPSVTMKAMPACNCLGVLEPSVPDK